jgi:hypothetical protein
MLFDLHASAVQDFLPAQSSKKSVRLPAILQDFISPI